MKPGGKISILLGGTFPPRPPSYTSTCRSGVRSQELAYQGRSFDHSVRPKARLHQALEQRKYAPKKKSKFLIEGLMFRVFCWSHDFRLRNGDPMHAPIWPHLPIVFFFEFRLFSIVSTFGIGLTLDGPTKLVSRPNVARVCVEVGLLLL